MSLLARIARRIQAEKEKSALSIPEQQLEAGVPEERVYVASQLQLMWWRFRKHRLAMVGTTVIAIFYLLAIFCEFLAPYDPNAFERRYTFVPPQSIHFFHEGQFHLRPFIYGLKRTRDAETYIITYEPDLEKRYPIYFFVKGDPYKMWGLFESDRHLFGLDPAADTDGLRIHLMGTDRLGRDMFSRLLYGSRISLSIGLIGVFLSFVIGILMGGISGYFGGVIDLLIQRLIEFLRSIPTIPLWMALSAALPRDWSSVQRYFAIVVLLSLIGWTGLARVVRGRFLAVREEEYVMAAKLINASELRVILRHMLPSFMSYIVASLTLAIPGMILGETSLSFLGLGLRPPTISWGVLLQEAQNLQTVALAPWLLYPAFFVVAAILSFNFMGDGLRDAADPYA
ncbi:ABC transporter permease [Litorilinea aerophila]|uniref:ABC transporter permease n=1 Tax=Litorilinea aerophila TaxID=1204385 RepID=A0A540VMT6_9CHLR|nr:ABC transporter permease [Litorilinea aerophila]GIV78121.1 MAG: peptide ABC transporter permease [Litorilinea sp.]